MGSDGSLPMDPGEEPLGCVENIPESRQL